MDRVWTGMFFQLHSHEWQDPPSQRRTFLQTHRGFCELASRVQPQQYVDGRGWRTSRTKILDNALIGFCKVELSDELDEQTIDMGRELSFRVPGLPPAKNEALSMLGAGHSHAPRVLELLRATKNALERSGFARVEAGPVALEWSCTHRRVELDQFEWSDTMPDQAAAISGQLSLSAWATLRWQPCSKAQD